LELQYTFCQQVWAPLPCPVNFPSEITKAQAELTATSNQYFGVATSQCYPSAYRAPTS
jgi:hypothetical protein